MKFTKMHGLGNDYIYINGFEETVEDPPQLSRLVSDRHFGVGGDGLIIVQPPPDDCADCRMEMYNADGSRAQMCGNGVRCVAKFAHDRGLVSGDTIRVATDAGLRIITIRAGANGVTLFEVGMGAPSLLQSSLPARVTSAVDEAAIEASLEVEGIGTVRVSCVSMGNPHCVIRLDERQPSPLQTHLEALDLASIGPLFEHHAAFPERTNTEFIRVRGRRDVDFRVWERGSGETLACGTGACAAVVAGVVGGYLDRQVIVHLRGGDLDIRWDDASDEVFMTGPAIEVFTTELNSDWLEAHQ